MQAPWRNKPLLRSPDSYIAAMHTANALKGCDRVLVVGDAGGRERAYLSALGKEVHVLDIAPQPEVERFLLQSIEEKTHFPDGYFDGVVMNEVLEHLFLDVTALEEVHRIIKPGGMLAITVPYFSGSQDFPEFHVRIHSQKTLRRLLERCGFSVDTHFYRGIMTRLPQLNLAARAFIYFSQRVAEVALGLSPDNAVHAVNGVFYRIERYVGKWGGGQKYFSSYGGMIKARRCESGRNFDTLQIMSFRGCGEP